MRFLFSFWTIGGTFTTLAVAGIAFRLFAPALFSVALAALKAFLKTKTGQTVALIAVALVAGWIAATYFVGVGKAIVNTQIEKETRRNEQTRETIDEQVDDLSGDALRRELDRWVRDRSGK